MSGSKQLRHGIGVKSRSRDRSPVLAPEVATRADRGVARATWRRWWTNRLLLTLVTMPMAAPGSGAANSAVADSAGVILIGGQTTPSVLVIYPENRLLPANIFFDRIFRLELGAFPGTVIDCFAEFLDEVQFPADHQDRMRDYLLAKYAVRAPSVIVAFAPPSFDFCARYCLELFPDAPMVFAAMDADAASGPTLGPRATGVAATFDGRATLRLALRLHPRTRQVFIVTAKTPAGRATSDLESTLRESAPEATTHLLPIQPLEQLLHTYSQLPKDGLVIDLSMFGRGGGTVIPPQDVREGMALVSSVPVYAASDPLVGYDLVGAVTTPIEEIGRATAAMVVQVLRRQNAGELPPVRVLPAAPIFDWRQLRRWGIRARQLPAGSILRFKPPSLWQQYSTQMITAGALFLLQSGLILALVFQSRRRRRAEREAQHRREELTHMTRVATMGELTASLAHEINQPLAAILSNAQAAQRLLAAGATDSLEIGEILADIAADDRRAGEVIRRMRALLRKGVGDPTVLQVNDLVSDVVGLVRGEMILQNVSLTLDLAPNLPPVHADRVQLQQVLLNLMMNALDAMKETSGGNRKVVVRTLATVDHSVQVCVEDSGPGVATEKLAQIFEPFVTTKPHGMGLGLAICRSIIQAHGGGIGFANNPERGANFWFKLPGVEETGT